MTEYCEKCKRCHDDGLRNDEECCYYGEPNGCNHPNHGYGVIVDKYEALQKENDELKETIEANLRVHKASEKADAERIWKLQKENAELRECIKKISKAITKSYCLEDCELYAECVASGHGCLAEKLAEEALKGE